MTYDFSLDRKSTFILGAGSVILALLVFVAGFLSGVTWHREAVLAASRSNPVTMAAVPPQKPASPKTSNGQPKPAGPPSPEPAVPAASASAAAPAMSKTEAEPPPAPAAAAKAVAPPAAASLSPAPEQSGVRLSIQVGSFLQKSNAEKLADQLKHSGYNPQIVLADIGSKQWNVVRIGPYQDWDEATQIAAQLSRDQAFPAVIHPIR